MSVKLEEVANTQYDKVSQMVEIDLADGEKVSKDTKIEGYWSGLLYLHSDTEENLISAFESRDKTRLEIIRLMLEDELKYVDMLLKG